MKLKIKKINYYTLGIFTLGGYGFVLVDAKRIKEIPCNGNLGFWKYT
jgi:hypothetical protein